MGRGGRSGFTFIGCEDHRLKGEASLLKFVTSTASWEEVGGMQGGLGLGSLDGRGEDAGANDKKRPLCFCLL